MYVLQASTTVAMLQAKAGKSESEQQLQQAQDELKVLSFKCCMVRLVLFVCSQAREYQVQELSKQLHGAKEDYAKMDSDYQAVKAQADHFHSLLQQAQSELKVHIKFQALCGYVSLFVHPQAREYQVQELSKQLRDAGENYAKMESGYQAVTAQADLYHSLQEQVAVLKETATQMKSKYAKLQEENQVLKLEVSAYIEPCLYTLTFTCHLNRLSSMNMTFRKRDKTEKKQCIVWMRSEQRMQ